MFIVKFDCAICERELIGRLHEADHFDSIVQVASDSKSEPVVAGGEGQPHQAVRRQPISGGLQPHQPPVRPGTTRTGAGCGQGPLQTLQRGQNQTSNFFFYCFPSI